MTILYHIYIVRDSFGDVSYDVGLDSNSIIYIGGIQNKNGESIRFESEAYHLKKWCQDNELDYHDMERDFTCYLAP